MVIEIELTKGKTALIDDVDMDLMEHKWGASFSVLWYARRGVQYRADNGELKIKGIKMHRIILERKVGRTLGILERTDHVNGDSLDNRRNNLRIATPKQNSRNGKKVPSRSGVPASSKYKGVSRRHWGHNGKISSSGKWRAKIKLGKSDTHLGYFTSETEAARAYDRAALEHFGEFARTNFDKEDYR